MARWWFLVLLAVTACRRQSAPPLPPSNAVAPPVDAAVAEAEEPAASDETCDEPTQRDIQIDGVRGQVELITCTTGETSDSDEAKEAGFIEKQRLARLVWRPPGKPAVHTELGDWTDGWEWGSSVTLAGVLVAPSGDGVALVIKSSYGVGPGIGAVGEVAAAYEWANNAWTETASVAAGTIEVTVSTNGTLATVSGCESDDSATPVGCGGYDDAKPIATRELRYDGSTVTVTQVP